MTEPRSLLLVGKVRPERKRSLTGMAAATNLPLVSIEDSAEALGWLEANDPACVIIDAGASRLDKLISKIRSKRQLAYIPVFSLVSAPDDLWIEQYFGWGGDDVVHVDAGATLLERLRAVPREATASNPTRCVLIGDPDRARTETLARVFGLAGFDVKTAIDRKALEFYAKQYEPLVIVANSMLGELPELITRSRQNRAKAVWIITAARRELDSQQIALAALERCAVVGVQVNPWQILARANELARGRGPERRRDARRPFGSFVLFRAAGSDDDDVGIAFNLSSGGMFIRTFAPVLSDDVWLEWRVPQDKTRVRIEGKVVWRQTSLTNPERVASPLGFGVEFCDYLGGARKHLERALDVLDGGARRNSSASIPPAASGSSPPGASPDSGRTQTLGAPKADTSSADDKQLEKPDDALGSSAGGARGAMQNPASPIRQAPLTASALKPDALQKPALGTSGNSSSKPPPAMKGGGAKAETATEPSKVSAPLPVGSRSTATSTAATASMGTGRSAAGVVSVGTTSTPTGPAGTAAAAAIAADIKGAASTVGAGTTATAPVRVGPPRAAPKPVPVRAPPRPHGSQPGSIAPPRPGRTPGGEATPKGDGVATPAEPGDESSARRFDTLRDQVAFDDGIEISNPDGEQELLEEAPNSSEPTEILENPNALFEAAEERQHPLLAASDDALTVVTTPAADIVASTGAPAVVSVIDPTSAQIADELYAADEQATRQWRAPEAGQPKQEIDLEQTESIAVAPGRRKAGVIVGVAVIAALLGAAGIWWSRSGSLSTQPSERLVKTVPSLVPTAEPLVAPPRTAASVALANTGDAAIAEATDAGANAQSGEIGWAPVDDGSPLEGYPPVEEFQTGNGRLLADRYGYLVVRFPEAAFIFSENIAMGATNWKIATTCGDKTLRIGVGEKPAIWLSEPARVKVECRGTTRVVFRRLEGVVVPPGAKRPIAPGSAPPQKSGAKGPASESPSEPAGEAPAKANAEASPEIPATPEGSAARSPSGIVDTRE